MTERPDFDSEYEWDFSRLGNWIEDNLDVGHPTASEMAEAALSVKYGPSEMPDPETTDTERQGYHIHSGPYETETEARENLKGVKGMVRKLRDGWYVLELCYVDTDTEGSGR